MRPKKPFKKFTSRSETPAKKAAAEASGTRLNKLLANAGICSRREADELIAMVKEAKGSVQAPKSVDFTDAIPLSALGKPDKKALRARYWGEGRQVG